jgi:hypothetical protein
MTDVLVATSAGRSEAAVSAVADAVAVVAHSRVRRIDLDTAPNGERGAAILLLREMDKPATTLSVLARAEPTPSTWQRVVRDAVKPVVVVPEAEELATPMISRVLVPLDGDAGGGSRRLGDGGAVRGCRGSAPSQAPGWSCGAGRRASRLSTWRQPRGST